MDMDPRMEAIVEALARPEGRAANFQRIRSVPFRPEKDILLISAARARDITISAYIRRAAMSFTAFDLGMSFDEISLGEWPVNRFGTGAGPRGENRRRANGKGAGRWQITGLTNK